MRGNVWQWCEDWYSSDYYKQDQARLNPEGPSTGSSRVLRGGSWNDVPRSCRAAPRVSSAPIDRYDFLGFRVVLLPASRTP